MDRGAWQGTVLGVTKSQTRLSERAQTQTQTQTQTHTHRHTHTHTHTQLQSAYTYYKSKLRSPAIQLSLSWILKISLPFQHYEVQEYI